jgi:type IV pilus assembly protein PilE
MKIRGFTLIELMIAVAIVGILAAIALPSYSAYVIRTNRGDVQSELSRLAAEIESKQMAYRRVQNIPVTSLGLSAAGSINYPNRNPIYTISLTPVNIGNIGSEAWTLSAAPVAGKANDSNGSVIINAQGQTCWIKGSACTPSASTSWDGR